MQASLGLDRELSELEAASLRVHVARCAACAGFEHEVAAFTRELRAAPFVPTRATIAVTGQAAVDVALPHRRRTRVRVLQLSAAAAAVALAGGLGGLAGSLSSHRTTTVTTARTTGGNRGAVLDRGSVAMAPEDNIPVARIHAAVPV